METSFNTTQFNNIDPAPDSEEGIIGQQVGDVNSEYFGKMLFAKSDEEVLKLIEEAKTKTNKLGLEKLLAYKTKKWQENLALINGSNAYSQRRKDIRLAYILFLCDISKQTSS